MNDIHTEKIRENDCRQVYPPFKLEALTRFMVSQGYSSERILENTQLDEAALRNIETRVSFRQLTGILRNIRRCCPDPAIALKAGQSIHISIYGLYGYVLLCAGSLRRGIESAIRYHELVMPTTHMALQCNDSVASFSFRDRLGAKDLQRLNLDLQLSLVYSLLQDTLGAAFSLNAIHLGFEKPEHWQVYEQLFPCPVRFGQPETAMLFPVELLDRPMPQQNLVTEELVRARCEALIAELKAGEDLVPKLHRYLKANLSNTPTSEEIAQQFCMTARTLRRKLTAHGTSYQALTDQVRKEQALILLMDTGMNVETIAERVGFSDAANFRRAFKRWTNNTPSAFRESLDLEIS